MRVLTTQYPRENTPSTRCSRVSHFELTDPKGPGSNVILEGRMPHKAAVTALTKMDSPPAAPEPAIRERQTHNSGSKAHFQAPVYLETRGSVIHIC